MKNGTPAAGYTLAATLRLAAQRRRLSQMVSLIEWPEFLPVRP
jgi:hypothetical protein